MLLEIHPDNPDERKLQMVLDCLNKGGVIVYPTDAVYTLGCDLLNHKAVEKVARIKGLKPEKANFSLICYDLSHISEYAKINNATYKIMKRALPGPYTFILNGTHQVPKIFKSKKKTVGIRVPDNNIAREIVQVLQRPIISTSIHDDDEIIEYTTDPGLIHEKYGNDVDIVIDGGIGQNVATTIIDCTEGYPEIIREGLGETEDLW